MEFKEIFYYLFILNLLQFSLTKTVENSSPPIEEETGLTPKQKLLDFYKSGLKNISKEYCEKAKNISEYILKDDIIKNAQTLQIQEFKENITNFLDKYESYARYGLYNDLVSIFADTTIHYVQEDEEMKAKNVTDDKRYIEKLLIKLDFIQLDDSYEDNYTEFIVNKFNKRYEEFKSQLTKDELIKEHDFIQFHDELEACKDYTCQIETFTKSVTRAKDNLVEYIKKSIRDIYIYYCDKAKKISNKLIEDAELLQTNTTVIQEFTKNITEFIIEYNNSNYNPDDLPYIGEIYSNATAYYFEIPKDKLNSDSILIGNVLRRLGSEQLEIECEEKFMDLVLNKISGKVLEFKSQLDKEELEKQKPLLDWYEELKSRKTRVRLVVEQLYNL